MWRGTAAVPCGCDVKGLWISGTPASPVKARLITASKLRRLRRALGVAVALALVVALVRFDVPPYGDRGAMLDRLLAGRQFDFPAWLASAALVKVGHELTLAQNGMGDAEQAEFVREYMRSVTRLQALNRRIEAAYVDPNVADPAAETAQLRAERDALRADLAARQNLAEAVLQEQVESVLREEGFAIGGQLMPPLRFRFTELPDVLIMSRRDHIERIASRELATGLPVDELDAIEGQVDRRFDVSSLVTPIGGLGAYPTMLPETGALRWVLGTAAHEWVHNYLLFTLSPVGMNYDGDPALRTINETTATIVEREIEARVIERYYPELAAPPPPPAPAKPAAPAPEPPAFDFREAMRETRLRVDALLAEGKIDDAEAYMEQRRRLFVENGYMLRKLNQAYFAFHGSYNADPGGSPAAGADPVGPAVQALRARSASLGDFLRAVGAITSFEDLQNARVETRMVALRAITPVDVEKVFQWQLNALAN